MSEGKVSMGLGVEGRRVEATEARLEGLRARRAMARLPWVGEARTRAMPAPEVGPAPMRIARPFGGIA